FSRVQILNGGKGWVQQMGNTEDMNEDQVADAKEGMYANSLADLNGIRDPGLKLTSLGESKVGDKGVVGVKATKEGHKEVKIYFDKETDLVVKMQRTAKNPMSGDDVDQEQLFDDYKEWSDGVKRPLKQTVKREGKEFLS